MPNRTHLTAETAPPPINPKLQYCIEENRFAYYEDHQQTITSAIDRMRNLDYSALPEDRQVSIEGSLDGAGSIFEKVAKVRTTAAALNDWSKDFRPVHQEYRQVESRLKLLKADLEQQTRLLSRIERQDNPAESDIQSVSDKIRSLEADISEVEMQWPAVWNTQREHYLELAKADKIARGQYRQSADSAYKAVLDLRTLLLDLDRLENAASILDGLETIIKQEAPDTAMDLIKERESALSELEGVSHIKSAVSKSRRALKGDSPDLDKSLAQLADAHDLYREELAWRQNAAATLLEPLEAYHETIKDNIGLRMQSRLPVDIAKSVAACLSHHKDVSLHF